MSVHLPKSRPTSEVILVGGGHSHLQVVEKYGAISPKPFRLTLINASSTVSYGGTYAAFIANERSREDSLIDLGHFCQKHGATFRSGFVNKIDLHEKVVHLEDSTQTQNYDTLSLDLGSSPKIKPKLAKEIEYALIKTQPVKTFLEVLDTLENEIREEKNKLHLTIIAGDDTSFEFAMALSRRFKNLKLRDYLVLSVVIPSDSHSAQYDPKRQRKLLQFMQGESIQVIANATPDSFDQYKQRLKLTNNHEYACQKIIWAYTNSGPSWIQEQELQLDKNGLVEVQTNLESVSHEAVYAVGDIASLEKCSSFSKSGIYSKNMGKVLAENIFNRFLGQVQLDYKSSSTNPSYILTGPNKAYIYRWQITLGGSTAYLFKNMHDREWQDRFTIKPKKIRVPTYLESGQLKVSPGGGSGTTLPTSILRRKGRHPRTDDWHHDTTSQKICVSSYTRGFSSDSVTVGNITVYDAISKIAGLGAWPELLNVTLLVPFASKGRMQKEAEQLMIGLENACERANLKLGSIAISASHELGVAVNILGSLQNGSENPWVHLEPNPGDKLVISGPLGTGVQFSGYNQYAVSTQHFDKMLTDIRQPSSLFLPVTEKITPTSALRVGAFGMAYQLDKKIHDLGLSAQIDLEKIPLFEGTLEAIRLGVRAALHVQNRMKFFQCFYGLQNLDLAYAEALFDPQTAGPTLFAVSEKDADEFVSKLRDQGFSKAAIIGKIDKATQGSQSLTFRGFSRANEP